MQKHIFGKYRTFGIVTTVAFVGYFCMFVSCNKWVDPKPIHDPRLDTPLYCNDPAAVNYNWGFPGKPDNTKCYYPDDMFKGKYVFIDSVYSLSGSSAGNFIFAQIDTLIINSLSHSKLTVTGFNTPADKIYLTAYTFNATVDTLVGDSLTATRGQLINLSDTVNGTIFYSRVDSLLHINLQIVNDTGITSHTGKAKAI